MNCIIKYDHEDGVPLPRYKWVTWCGKNPQIFDWLFTDVQHIL